MAVTVTNSTLTALNSNLKITANAATSTVAGGSEVFTYTPKVSGGKMLLLFQEGSTAATALPSYSIAAGDMWAAKAITGSFGSSAAAGAINALEIDTARVMQNDGTIAITVSPGSSVATLKTTHAMKLYALELL